MPILIASLLALQSLAAAATMNAEDFDLRKLPKREGCAPGMAGEIVVCGRIGENDRLKPVADANFEPKPLRAEMAIGSARGSLYVEQKNLPGASSQRMMVGLKLPF